MTHIGSLAGHIEKLAISPVAAAQFARLVAANGGSIVQDPTPTIGTRGMAVSDNVCELGTVIQVRAASIMLARDNGSQFVCMPHQFYRRAERPRT